jgi:hypothetical protein
MTGLASEAAAGSMFAAAYAGSRQGGRVRRRGDIFRALLDLTAPGSTISSSTGCDPVTITADTGPAGTTLTCAATSDGSTTTTSVTVKRDATPPTVLYAGNQASDGILQTVAITCTASDPSSGSGLVSSSCAGIQGRAYGFGAGVHTFSADRHPDGSRPLHADQVVRRGSAKFRALGPKQQTAVDAIVTGTCNAIAKIVVNLGPKQTCIAVHPIRGYGSWDDRHEHD